MKKKRLNAIWILLGMIVLGLFFFFPLYWTFITSFKTSSQIFVEKPLFVIDTFYLDNYIEIFQKTNVTKFFLNSMVVSTVTTIVSLVIATMAGFGFCRYNFKGKKALQNSVLIVRMIPALVFTIPYYIIYNKLHMLDTILGLILAYIGFALPLAIWLAINFFSEWM